MLPSDSQAEQSDFPPDGEPAELFVERIDVFPTGRPDRPRLLCQLTLSEPDPADGTTEIVFRPAGFSGLLSWELLSARVLALFAIALQHESFAAPDFSAVWRRQVFAAFGARGQQGGAA